MPAPHTVKRSAGPDGKMEPLVAGTNSELFQPTVAIEVNLRSTPPDPRPASRINDRYAIRILRHCPSRSCEDVAVPSTVCMHCAPAGKCRADNCVGEGLSAVGPNDQDPCARS